MVREVEKMMSGAEQMALWVKYMNTRTRAQIPGPYVNGRWRDPASVHEVESI